MSGPPATATTVAAVLPTAGTRGVLSPIGGRDVRVTGGFWAERARINREATIPAGFAQLQAAGTLENFRLAARSARDGYRALGIMFDKPFPFLDSDVYKWLEGVAWELGRSWDDGIAAMADQAIAAWIRCPTQYSSWPHARSSYSVPGASTCTKVLR